MVIEVNKPALAVAFPVIALTGIILNEADGSLGTGVLTVISFNTDPSQRDLKTTPIPVTTFSNPNIVVNTGNNSVEKRDPIVFQGDVMVNIGSNSSNYSNNSYSRREDKWNSFRGDIIGVTAQSTNQGPQRSTVMNDNAEIYYTVNGKDPVRTKAYLYTNDFSINHNLTGSDKIVLKARAYWRGEKSIVNKVEFRIVRTDESIV